MKSNLREFIRGVSLQDAILGAVLGLLISAAIQPFAIGFFTDVWVAADAPGYNAPPLDAGMSKIETSHTEGEEVSEYGGITWKDEFEVYRVSIQNTGDKPAYDVEATVPLSGCIMGVSEDNPFSEEDYSLRDILSGGIGGEHNKSVYYCSKIVSVDRLFPEEKIVLDFVVEDEFRSCQVLAGVHENPEIILDYRWTKSSKYYSKTTFETEPGLQSEYSDFKERNSGAYIEASNRHGRVYGVLIPYDTSNVSKPRDILRRCRLTLPE